MRQFQLRSNLLQFLSRFQIEAHKMFIIVSFEKLPNQTKLPLKMNEISFTSEQLQLTKSFVIRSAF